MSWESRSHTFATFSTEKFLTCLANSWKFSVLSSMYFLSCKSFFIISFIIAFKRAILVPGFNCRCISAILAKSIFLGSATISLAPFFFACLILVAITG